MPAASGCFSSAKFSCKFVGSANKSAARSPMAADSPAAMGDLAADASVDKKLPIGNYAASVCSVWAHSMIAPHIPPINQQLIRTLSTYLAVVTIV